MVISNGWVTRDRQRLLETPQPCTPGDTYNTATGYLLTILQPLGGLRTTGFLGKMEYPFLRFAVNSLVKTRCHQMRLQMPHIQPSWAYLGVPGCTWVYMGVPGEDPGLSSLQQ